MKILDQAFEHLNPHAFRHASIDNEKDPNRIVIEPKFNQQHADDSITSTVYVKDHLLHFGNGNWWGKLSTRAQEIIDELATEKCPTGNRFAISFTQENSVESLIIMGNEREH